MNSLELARNQMVTQQVRAWDVLDQRVLGMLENLPRERFVPGAFRQVAFADTAIPLPHGQRMMTPTVEGRVLQALVPQPGERALEIGTGSGFLAACLSRLGADVLSLDIFPDFTEQAGATLKSLGIRRIKLETEDGTRFDAGKKRFDVIAVTGSLPVYTDRYAQQLAVGGRLFMVVGEAPVMEALLITRVGEAAWSRRSLFETDLPALVNAPLPTRFVF
ncbi:MAG TPA: protein-L-isoaspartate O-methyltransferase [Gammaproteobacteria bacterium]|nr:protein-L-isoaspartate O-methyltransferase [Gammaproteobacteria bacterium]